LLGDEDFIRETKRLRMKKIKADGEVGSLPTEKEWIELKPQPLTKWLCFGVIDAIETSTNFPSWTHAAIATNTFGTAVFKGDPATNAGPRFYRGIMLP
jgi:lysozyme family protein